MTWHYWWFTPMIVFLFGLVWAEIHSRNNPNIGGMFPDIAPVLIVLGCLIAAISTAIGHFL